MLYAIRNNPSTLAATLKSDWLPMTLVAATGGLESFTMQFFDVFGGEILASVSVNALGANERSLAQILIDEELETDFEMGAWRATHGTLANIAQIAYIKFTSVVGTIYVGRGATSTSTYGTFAPGTTWSVTGPAAGTSVNLANTSYGIGA